MNIAENLKRIVQAKSDIKTAIENKGVFVGDVTIDHYADKIDMISGAAGDEKIKLSDGICLSGSTWSTFDMGRYNWSNVHDWGSMFEGCNNLETLENMPKNIMVGNMRNMFYNCSNLSSLDLSSWDTSNVTDMNNLFGFCDKLTTVGDISNWNTSKVTDMTALFMSNKMTSLDLSKWDTSNVTTMQNMFALCGNLREVRMGGDVSKVTNVVNMFNVIYTEGTFYYNPQYDYSTIIAVLPGSWTAVPME